MNATMRIETMLISSMQKVCQDCGTTMEMYENSNQYWAQINPQFALLSMLMMDKMKLMMPKTKDATVEDALAVFDFQIKIYPTLTELQVESPELLPLIKQAWLSDMVKEEFGLEEEDYIKAPGLERNMAFRQKAEQLAHMIQQEAMMMGGGMMGQGMF